MPQSRGLKRLHGPQLCLSQKETWVQDRRSRSPRWGRKRPLLRRPIPRLRAVSEPNDLKPTDLPEVVIKGCDPLHSQAPHHDE